MIFNESNEFYTIYKNFSIRITLSLFKLFLKSNET